MTAPPGWTVVPADEPCTGCGECCRQLPCGLARGRRPCIALQHHDGRHWCGLVELGVEGAADYLLIGKGCGATLMPERLMRRVRA